MMQASSDINNFTLRSTAFSKRGVSRSEWLSSIVHIWAGHANVKLTVKLIYPVHGMLCLTTNIYNSVSMLDNDLTIQPLLKCDRQSHNWSHILTDSCWVYEQYYKSLCVNFYVHLSREKIMYIFSSYDNLSWHMQSTNLYVRVRSSRKKMNHVLFISAILLLQWQKHNLH